MVGSEAPYIERVPLGPLTWFKIGGLADLLARPRTPDELADLLKRSNDEGVPVRVIGGGSNVLVADTGFRGTVVALTAPPFKSLARTGDDAVQCGAGGKLGRLANALADWGLKGGEGLAGIPGTVGGALRTNSGTSAGEIGSIVKRVWALDRDGSPVTLSGPECEFGYRQSALGDLVILGAELLTSHGDVSRIRAAMKELRDHRAKTQPKGVRSAGCVFKNPEGTSAGKLLDELGVKEMRKGEARVSPMHANFIEAGPGAKAADVVWLIDEMKRVAFEQRGVTLELQLELWGFDDAE